MLHIYILKLEKDKYYVGKTQNPDFRLENHFASNGSEWTKKYKPISVIELLSNCDDFDEDKYTIKYMEIFGINNVRGGSFCQIILSNNNIETLKQMINGSTDKCYICGKSDHFVKDCKKRNECKEVFIDGPCNCTTSYFSSHRKSKCVFNNSIKYVTSLFANEDDIIEDLKPNDLINITTMENLKQNDLINIDSVANIQNKDEKIPTKKQPSKIDVCYKCGRKGHFAKSCYAKKHINGTIIN
jgi:hypothetical protein